MKIISYELFQVPPRWLFLKIVTDEGIVFKEDPKKSKGKKVVLIESITITFENIKQAKVQISFK